MAGKEKLGPVPAEIVNVTAGGVKRLKVNGHMFRRSKVCEGSEYWSCLERGCGMTAVTRDGLLTLLGGVPARGHTHPPASPYQQLVQTLTNNLLRRVRTDVRTPMPAVYQQEVDSLMAAVSAVMPSYEMVRSRLYRARQASITAKRRSDSPPGDGDGDGGATWVKRERHGAATWVETDGGGGGAAANEELALETVVEVVQVPAEAEDASDSVDACSHADSDVDSVGRGAASEDRLGRAEERADAGGGIKYEESALAAVERRHGIGADVTERDVCDGEEYGSELAAVEKWHGLDGAAVGGGAVQTSDLPPVKFITSARGLPIMQVLQYQFRRWKMTKSSPLVEYWTCTNEHCRSTAVTRARRLTRLRQRHEHRPPTASCRRTARLAVMRQRAREEATAIPQIYQQERDGAGRPADFPALGSVRTILYRERQLARQERLAAAAAADAEALEAAAAGMAVVVVEEAAGAGAAGSQISGQPCVEWPWPEYGQHASLWRAGPV